nr:MAG TPA: tail tape measure protein [Caudoviricetes sp.]
MAKPVEIEILLKDRMSAGLETMQHKLDALMGKASGTDERVRILSTAIAALNAQLAEMRKTAETAVPDLDQSKNISAMEALKSKIRELQEQLRQLDETAENTDTVPAGATQDGRQYNGLHMSVQQIARELPAATMGLNMFFLAISNNLPVLTDEIKRAKVANEELKASGQSTVPVWRQLISSIFSWQTALMVAITVLSMYGKEIASWVGSLFKSKDALEETRREQEKLNKSMADARTSAAKETAGLRVLYAMTQNANASMRDRTAAVKELQSQYPAYFGSLSQEAILAGNASAAYRQLTQDIMSAAYARAYQERLEDLASKNVDELRGSQADYNYMSRNKKAYDDAVAYMNSAQGKADRNQYAFSKTDAHTRAQSGVTIDPEAIERYEKYAKVIDDFETRRERWQRHNENYKRNEATMQSYEDEILKRQSAVEKTTQGASYEQDRKEAEREAERRAKEEERIGKERLKARKDLDKDLLALQRQNQDDETALMQDGTQKKLAEIDNDYKQRIAEIDRQETEFRKKNKEAGLAGLGADGLTDEQADALQKARDNAAKEQEHKTQEVYASEARAMRNYLKEYGTYQQQKLAIAEEYAEKINKAQTEGERLSLTAERDRSLQQVEINAIKQNIDWGSVFGEFGMMFKEQLRPTIDRLKTIAQSDSFKQSGIDEQKTLYELIDRLERSNTVWDSDIFRRVSDDIKAYQTAMQNYMAAVESARKAEADYVNAQNAHAAAVKSGDNSLIQATQAAVDETKSAYMAASDQVKEFGAQVQCTTTDLNSSALQARSMFEDLASGLRGLSSGSLQGIGNGAMQLDKLFGGKVTEKAGNALAKGFQSLLGKDSEAAKTLTAALGDSGLAGEIISAVLGLLDMLAQDGIGGIVSSLMDTVLGSVSGVLDDVLSGGIITKPMQSVVNGVGNILDSLTFGGLGSWLGGNDKEVMETVNRLTESNEYLRESIDSLAERIGQGDNTNAESIDYYNDARKAELEWEENQRNIIKGLASAWTNTGYGFLGLGGKGSFNKHSPGSGWEGWDAFTETLRKNGFNITVDSTGDLWNLTPEQMELLRDSNPKEWQKLFSGDGHKNPKSAVEEYIERAGTLEELTDALNEKLTGYTWNGFLEKYKVMVRSAEDITEELGDFISETVTDALIESFVNEELKDDIKELYEYIADAAADGISEEEKARIEAMNSAIADKAESWREAMTDSGMIDPGSYGTSQSGRAGAYTAMSQEQGTKLEGLWTTSAMHLSSMDEKMQDVSAQMGTAVDSLRRIEENTGNSAKHLGEIKEDIKKMIRDGVKVK